MPDPGTLILSKLLTFSRLSATAVNKKTSGYDVPKVFALRKGRDSGGGETAAGKAGGGKGVQDAGLEEGLDAPFGGRGVFPEKYN